MDLELINWIRGGRYRIRILQLLYQRPMLPSEIADQLGITRSSVSRMLKDLHIRGLVSCIDAGSRTRTYFLQQRALDILRDLEQLLS